MSAAKPKVFVEPRIYSRREVAQLLGKGDTWFSANLPRLVAEGMPLFDPLLNGWDAKAIHLWLDRRSGLISDQQATVSDFTDAWLKASRTNEAEN